MRELDLPPQSTPHPRLRLAIVGRGRLGVALVKAFAQAGVDVDGPFGHGADGAGRDVVLLCVPDGAISEAAALIGPGACVGHCSGALGLEPLAGRRAFSLHPLMTVTGGNGGRFAGAAAAIAGDSQATLDLARWLALRLEMIPVELRPEDRPAYHAAASIASNFLVTLEAAAEKLAATAGVGRQELAPLVRATVENWAALGATQALTGPVARGDEATVALQRAAIENRAPDLLPLFDALVQATRKLVASPELETATR